MLEHGEAKVAIAPKMFRGFDYEAMFERLRPDLPGLRQVVIVDGAGSNSYEALLSGPEWEKERDARDILTRSRPGPDDVTQLLYTSGTTGESKGVMHSANSLMANITPYAARLHLTNRDVVLMASPMAHQTGFMYGLMMPIMLGASAVLQDIWEPRIAIELARAEGVTFTMASTPFLTDLTKTAAETGVGIPSLRTFLCAGAPIPGALVEQARKGLGAKIVSAWGMTENGAVTLIRPEDDDELAFTTDGCPLPGVEIRIVGANGEPLPPGEIGRLLVRSASNFGGYLHRPQWNNTDPDDWFDTGDLARADVNGYIRICGRTQGRDHPRRREYSRGGDRGAALPPSLGVAGRDRRLSRRTARRAGVRRGCRQARTGPRFRRDGRIPEVAQGRAAIHPRTLDLARRDAGHAVGQDSEVQVARDGARHGILS